MKNKFVPFLQTAKVVEKKAFYMLIILMSACSTPHSVSNSESGKVRVLENISTYEETNVISFDLEDQGIFQILKRDEKAKRTIFRLRKLDTCWLVEDVSKSGGWIEGTCSSKTHSFQPSSKDEVELIIDSKIPPSYVGGIGCIQSSILAICKQTRTNDNSFRYLITVMINEQKSNVLLKKLKSIEEE